MSGVIPYLFFSGRCEEALAFYAEAVGAQVGMVMHFHESPTPLPPGVLAPGFEQKVMHAEFRVAGTQVFASDGCDDTARFSGFSLAMSCSTIDEVRRAFDALSSGGTVTMPLEKTFWSELYGMLTDRFGINWMVMVKAPDC